ncbi:TPM domain-containing protein [Lactobacillus selangorensis]|nr:TPM domain-containing protein [Lactobacillus selangorensis]
MRRALRLMALSLVGLFLFFIGTGPVQAESLPARPTTNFYDQAGILSETTKQRISTKNEQYATTKQKPQVVVAVVKSTHGDTVDSYAPDLFQKWGIGQKSSDNGILILYAVNNGQRNVRIEVGYGLEDVIPDATAGKILALNQNLLKSSSTTKEDEGLRKTFNAVTTIIDKHYGYQDDGQRISQSDYQQITQKQTSASGGSLLDKIITIVVIVFIVVFFFGGGSGGSGNGRGGRRRIPWWLFMGGGGFGSGGGWSGGSGSSGGFGGWSGGGGSSGGGGASI